MDNTILDEIINLRKRIIEADRAYYVDSNPIISDKDYDLLFDRLKRLEKEYPEYDDPLSPIKRVGSDLDTSLEEKKHSIPVLSLDKAYSLADIKSWIDKREKTLLSNLSIVVEPKIDGLSVVLYYNNGGLLYGLTRGNGVVGNDITNNLKTIKSIPLVVNYKKKFAVRGEVFMKREQFAEFNEKYANGIYSNPRNLASGAIKRIKSTETALFPLSIFIYELFLLEEGQLNSHIDSLNFLKNEGFLVNDYLGFFSSSDKKEFDSKKFVSGSLYDVLPYIDSFKNIRNKIPYDIDGLVIKIDSLLERDKLGLTEHHPRWAIAFKFEAPLAETILESIDIQIGRGGRATPVANLKPVELAGSTISRATLHNQDYINAIGVNVNDRVSISKRGDVIPAVEEVIEKGEHLEPFQIPLNCPSCNSPLYPDGAHLFCKNENCKMKVLGGLQYFIGRNQMDIESLGDKTIEFLFEKGFVKSITDIYEFNYDRLSIYEGFKEKKINNIKDSVEKSKNVDFKTLLYSLGLKDIGKKTAELLVKNFKSMDNIINEASKKEITIFSKIDGIGGMIATSIIEHFNNPNIIELTNKFKSYGFILESNESDDINSNLGFLSGTKWVITGSFENFKPREKAAELIESFDGIIMDAISSKTNYLLAGSGAGSKLDKAKKLNIKIIDEEEFIKIINEKTIFQ